jgi:hypothetical protein
MTYTCVCMYVCIRVCVCMCVYTCVHRWHTHVSVCMYVYVCVYVCVYTRVCIDDIHMCRAVWVHQTISVTKRHEYTRRFPLRNVMSTPDDFRYETSWVHQTISVTKRHILIPLSTHIKCTCIRINVDAYIHFEPNDDVLCIKNMTHACACFIVIKNTWVIECVGATWGNPAFFPPIMRHWVTVIYYFPPDS